MGLVKKGIAALFFVAVYFGFFWVLPLVGYVPEDQWLIRVGIFHGIAVSVSIVGMVGGWSIKQFMDGK